MLTTLTQAHPLRDVITNAYRMDETLCIDHLIQQANLPESMLGQIATTAKDLVSEARKYKKLSKLNVLLQEYSLSTDEGIALMCLAEALLRIPDTATRDKFIADKIATINWKHHLKTAPSFFIHATTWSLLLTGKIYKPLHDDKKGLLASLERATSHLGITMIRPIILQIMKSLGEEFIIGQSIESALTHAKKLETMGYGFSFDMLGEAARTAEDAQHYFDAYAHAIDVIGNIHSNELAKNHGISIKLSALHPRYEYSQRERVLQTLPTKLLILIEKAKKNNIRIIIDAEEADRLDLSLDIFEIVFADASLTNWEGLGLAIQAYQKRTFYVIDWLADLAKRHTKRIIVRLVKGAYWDAEIKTSQVLGLSSYPVFTRKNSTDISYIACAKKLLSQSNHFYSQFGTHNAYSIAAVLELIKIFPDALGKYEFQCLHGMGRPLYDHLINPSTWNQPCRIYAPVGTYQDLLGYLVRRILENGANTSFINQLFDENIPIEKIIFNPMNRIAMLPNKPHPAILLPENIYNDWLNSSGLDLTHPQQLLILKKQMEEAAKNPWRAESLIHQKSLNVKNYKPVLSPNDGHPMGEVSLANETDVDTALTIAANATHLWASVPAIERANILEYAAEAFQRDMPMLITLLCKEGGKCIPDGIAEIRETIDYCRYYAYRARLDLTPITLPGPTGENNQLSLHPRGIMTCISPWNFPLAIFTGQIVAALVTGNVVIAKPALQTPFIAYHAIQILHRAGIPKNVLQLLIGNGSTIGAKLVGDPRVAGVMFTGSTETAKSIERSLANRSGPIALFIAETGGQNAMIVDSSALPEQAVIDIVQSAFNSAGQRCSALRVLFVQEEFAPKLLTMLTGYLAELTIGDPSLLATDIGPVIDESALHLLKKHFAKMDQQAKFIAQAPLSKTGPGYYFSPCIFEINSLSILEGEVFGPILHIIRYRAHELNNVIKNIIDTGYGLTLGVHSRIDSVVESIVRNMPIGNIYINRNMIGAVVGVQPFGGEGLSGTGPKAGGPHYLPRLCVERSTSINTVAVGGNAHLVSLIEDS